MKPYPNDPRDAARGRWLATHPRTVAALACVLAAAVVTAAVLALVRTHPVSSARAFAAPYPDGASFASGMVAPLTAESIEALERGPKPPAVKLPPQAPLTAEAIEALARRFKAMEVKLPATAPSATPEPIPVAAAAVPRSSEMAYPQVVIEEAERRVSDGSWRASLQAMTPAAVEREIASLLAVNNYLQIRTMRLVSRDLPPREARPLNSPIVGDAELLAWTVNAVLAPYNVDYYNYQTELSTASEPFTVKGWNTWAASFIDSGNLAELKRERLLCSAQAQRAAVIHQVSYVQGALAYQVKVPIVQTCENVNRVRTINLDITALVIRTNSGDHPDGLAIDQLVSSLHG